MNLQPGISVVLLAYKEADNLRVLLPQIKNYVERCKEPYEIIVIDTKEPLDDTKGVCRQFGAKYYNQRESGFGGALREGVRRASMDKFLILDSDGSHKPKYIPLIYHKFVSGAYDVVIGSRYVKGGKTNDSKISYLMSIVLNSVFRICLGIKAKDLSTDYRMYDTRRLKKVRLRCKNYDVLQEVLLKLQLKNPSFKIGEIPITFEKRMFGESKRQLLKFIISYLKTLLYLIDVRIRYTARKKKERIGKK